MEYYIFSVCTYSYKLSTIGQTKKVSSIGFPERLSVNHNRFAITKEKCEKIKNKDNSKKNNPKHRN